MRAAIAIFICALLSNGCVTKQTEVRHCMQAADIGYHAGKAGWSEEKTVDWVRICVACFQ